MGEKEDLKKVIEIIKEDGPSGGLYLSTAATPGTKSKTSIWCPSSFPERQENFPIGMDIPVMEGDGFTRLGAPLGDEDFTSMNITERVDKVKTILETLSGLEDGRFEYVLLIIFQVAQTANLAPLKETRALLPSTDSRPADVLFPRFSSGRDKIKIFNCAIFLNKYVLVVVVE